MATTRKQIERVIWGAVVVLCPVSISLAAISYLNDFASFRLELARQILLGCLLVGATVGCFLRGEKKAYAWLIVVVIFMAAIILFLLQQSTI
jgi:hypothetical protein